MQQVVYSVHQPRFENIRVNLSLEENSRNISYFNCLHIINLSAYIFNCLGKLLWSYDSGSEIESSPAISRDDGTLFVGLVQDKVIAIDTAAGPMAGRLRWSTNAGGEVISSPVLTEDGRVSFRN